MPYEATRQDLHLLCTPIDGPQQTTGLTRQMKPHVHVKEMGEGVSRYLSNCPLGHASKNGIPQFREQGRKDSGQRIYDGSRSAQNDV